MSKISKKIGSDLSRKHGTAPVAQKLIVPILIPVRYVSDAAIILLILSDVRNVLTTKRRIFATLRNIRNMPLL